MQREGIVHMETWKKNLYILWIGCFLCSVGINMIIPFLPLFVQELGVTDVKDAALWSAMIFGANHFVIAIVSPIWGRLSDRFGQKMMMIRSGLGMGIIIIGMGFVHTPLQLLLLRVLFGTVAGFMTSATAFMAIDTPKEHVGKALGTLQTGSVTGQLMGPLFGGLLAATFGMRNAFFLTGFFILIATAMVIFTIVETRTYEKLRFNLNWLRRDSASSPPELNPTPKPVKQSKSLIALIKEAPVLLTLFVSTYLIAASMQSINPIITLYVKQLHVEDHVEIIGGLIFASSALGTMLAAPLLGRLGDRFGHTYILIASVLCMAILNIPQAIVDDPWSLFGIRFLAGLCVGGLVPSVSSLLRSTTAPGIQGSIFGYNQSANSFGNVSGAMFGGIVASQLGIPYVFYFITGMFALLFLMLLFQMKSIEKARLHDSGNG
jgi:MFS transporter, DHA1 family, multidrug resistance protein